MFWGCESWSWCHMLGAIVDTVAYTARVHVLTANPCLQFIAEYFVMIAHSSPFSQGKFFSTDMGQWFQLILFCCVGKQGKCTTEIGICMIACRTCINVLLGLEKWQKILYVICGFYCHKLTINWVVLTL